MNATLSLIQRALARRGIAVYLVLLTILLARPVSAERPNQWPQAMPIPELIRTAVPDDRELATPTPDPADTQPPHSRQHTTGSNSGGSAGILFSAPIRDLIETDGPQRLQPMSRLVGSSPGVAFSAASEAPSETYWPQHPPRIGFSGSSPGVAFSAPGALSAETYLPQPQPQMIRMREPSGGIAFSAPGEDAYQINWANMQLSDEPTLPPDEAGDIGAGSTPHVDEDQTLGEAPEETNTNIQFLRQDTILLDPGQYQIDVTFQYLADETDFALAQVQGSLLTIAEARRRDRLMLMPIELRLGITPVVQFFVNVPFGYSSNQFVFNALDEFSSAGGIGDVSAGLTKQLVDGDDRIPDVLATLAFSAPTGKSTFAASLATPGSTLGEGFWTTTLALTFIQTYDPIVVFYGLGYRHRFENSFENNLTGGAPFAVNPGKQSFYRFGAGFAVNPRVTLSASFLGSYIGADKVNAVRVAGGSREPMQVRLATTIVRKGKSKGRRVKTVEPFVNFGLTEGAVDSLIGISWTH